MRAVGGAVVDDDDFVVEFAVRKGLVGVGVGGCRLGWSYCSVKVWLRSQIMMGRLRRSL